LIRLEDRDRILSKAECDSILQRVRGLAKVDDLILSIASWWQGELRWGRNRVSLGSDRRDVQVSIKRLNAFGEVTTNQLDDASLEDAVRAAERMGDFSNLPMPAALYPPVRSPEAPKTAGIWSDATGSLSTKSRSEIVRALVEPAEAKGMISAGYVALREGAMVRFPTAPKEQYRQLEVPYVAWTHGQCSMTVRDPTGSASGWAGLSSYDWTKIDAGALAERALQKCLASQHPVALEPGRYTVILEPQAVCDLMDVFLQPSPASHPLNRMEWTKPPGAEGGVGPFVLAPDEVLNLWRTKLGLKVVDERITISHDPTDPELGILPDSNYDMGPVTWIDRGILTNLAYDRMYALGRLPGSRGVRFTTGYRMSGGETSIDEMIQSTKRGLLVTRFSDIRGLEPNSLLATGVTRDGLWLIENGKISKAVKNLRFTESPLFVLNSLEQLGTPVPTFRPVEDPFSPIGLTPAIVPPLKARDFSFTSLIDAI
jgi:predicted Zn-dependent protease